MALSNHNPTTDNDGNPPRNTLEVIWFATGLCCIFQEQPLFQVLF